jgi:pimeloyl-ACP methyl ester carboxylesterase
MDVLRRNNVTVSGDGPATMLLAHGYGCDQTMWNLISPHFAKTHRVVAFDYVGCGQSDLAAYDPYRYASLHGYAQDVVEICDALDISNATFVGHSVSSMVGLLAAKARPDRIHDLVMLCPSPRYINEAEFTWGFDREAIDGLLDMIERAGGRDLVPGRPGRQQRCPRGPRRRVRRDVLRARSGCRSPFRRDNVLFGQSCRLGRIRRTVSDRAVPRRHRCLSRGRRVRPPAPREQQAHRPRGRRPLPASEPPGRDNCGDRPLSGSGVTSRGDAGRRGAPRQPVDAEPR